MKSVVDLLSYTIEDKSDHIPSPNKCLQNIASSFLYTRIFNVYKINPIK